MASRPQSGSWLTLEMGAGALSPLLVWEQGPSSAPVPRGPESLGPPLPLHQAVCVSPCVCLWGVTRHPASLPSQPLFKKFTQTRWAAPEQTLEEILSTVADRLPEFSELLDCFREVRRCWAGGWAWQGRGTEGWGRSGHAP